METEQKRLAALFDYDILDTPAEEIFNDFVMIAAEICDTPMALVSFLDRDRQWFAAERGLGLRETPIESSICAHVAAGTGVLVVPDLTQDARFKANVLVTEQPNLRFYGGAVLKTPDGVALGAVCVLDDKPRPAGLSPPQIRALEALARQVTAQLELRRASRQRSEAWAAQDALLAETKALLAEKNAALAEKDLLMLEVHHRVKNSLSTVQSLLQLQARMTAHTEVAAQLQDSANRVRTFGAMHEVLYRVGASTEVDLTAYLCSLLDEQRKIRAGMPGSRDILFHPSPGQASWPSADTPTLGLILVELVTNAMKYGAGAVTVTLDHRGNEVVLVVEDEGQGLPVDFNPAESRGFGMRIVTGLLKNHQRGRLAIDRSCGHTCFVVTLRAPPRLG